jgi:hypothetical protein
VCQQINQVEILEEKRSVAANALRGLRVEHRATIGGGVDRLLVVAVGSCRSEKESISLCNERSGCKKTY